MYLHSQVYTDVYAETYNWLGRKFFDIADTNKSFAFTLTQYSKQQVLNNNDYIQVLALFY